MLEIARQVIADISITFVITNVSTMISEKGALTQYFVAIFIMGRKGGEIEEFFGWKRTSKLLNLSVLEAYML